MRAEGILRRLLERETSEIHARRVRAVVSAVVALVLGGEIVLSRLGRAVAGRTTMKHGIKRIDRLFGNGQLREERHVFYRAIARKVIGRQLRPVVLVDWTEAGKKACVLAAAVAFEGRAVIIYSEAHPLSRYTSSRVETEFLRKLTDLLPENCRPIIVTDAGFRAPWLRKVLGLGWDYVGRVRGRTLVRPAAGGDWRRYYELYSRARIEARDLGQWEVNRSAPYTCRLVTVRRRRRWVPIDRALAQRSRERAIAATREPWLLVTSLRRSSAKRVVAIYKLRMQIEETFRDAKSHRFGWSFDEAAPRRWKRIDVMMLLIALAAVVVLAVGKAAEVANLHLAYQANTIRTRRVLSLATLGRLILLRLATAPHSI